MLEELKHQNQESLRTSFLCLETTVTLKHPVKCAWSTTNEQIRQNSINFGPKFSWEVQSVPQTMSARLPLLETLPRASFYTWQRRLEFVEEGSFGRLLCTGSGPKWVQQFYLPSIPDKEQSYSQETGKANGNWISKLKIRFPEFARVCQSML